MILVVEDNPAIAAVFVAALEDAGYAVESTSTGAAGLAALLRGDVELALVDLSLPDINGAELAVQARAAGSKTPIIAVSGVMPLIAEDRIAEAGFAGTFAKPVRLSVLLAAVAEKLPPR